MGMLFLAGVSSRQAIPVAGEKMAAPAPLSAPFVSEPTPSSVIYPTPSTIPSSPLAPLTLPLSETAAWEEAVARVEEVRGSAGRIMVPPALQHYDDRRRFLALQMADSREEDYELPHDHAALAQMIERGELVELHPLAEDYVLYEVGTDAREDPLAHYDIASGQDVPLFASLEEYEKDDARLSEEAAGPGAAAAKARARRELLAGFYQDPGQRDLLFREHAAVTRLAADFGGASYDLSDPVDRSRFQARLLSFIRPAARDVMLRVARAYHERFGRLLPVTSLVRTQRYQRRLARLNPNATHVDMPPHATGMAFDISYKFMAPDEQNFVMEEAARLEEEGRVEALRERRNHIHVYAFADGQRPPEGLVSEFLEIVEAAHPSSAPRPAVTQAPRRGRAPTRLRGGARAR